MDMTRYAHILRWYRSFGIDLVFSVIPEDLGNHRHAASEKVAFAPERCEHFAVTRDPQGGDSYEKLQRDIERLDCPIKRMARNTVICDGPLNSSLMIIGEAPGQDEDLQGKPFVGQSGGLLNNMISAIGFARTSVLISNIVFWRPPGNRTPSVEEISVCLPYVKRLINIAKPKVILLMGSVAAHAILNNNFPISKCRGSVTERDGIKIVSTFHPAYLLRSSTQKKLVFNDLILIDKMLKNS